MIKLKYFYCFAKYALVLLFFISHYFSKAQTPVIIQGNTFDSETKLFLPRLMIINQRTNLGVFANVDGSFSIKIYKTDTLIFSSEGYKFKKICIADSVNKTMYHLDVAMEKLQYTLKEISVFANRTLNEIEKDIAKLDSASAYASFKEINSFESPITYLYMRFSKFGKSKIQVAEWENEDLKKQILKDLFRLYIKHDIIELSEDEFEAFIKYCNLSEEFIKTASQLELVMAIKGKYESFKLRWH